RDLARLFYKYGRGDLLPHSWVDDNEFETSDLDGDGKPSASRAAELANDLEALGPTFVKVGQFLSTRADVLPASYIEALGRLQDHVAPFAFTEVERIVAEELGARISKVFSSFD